jgi:hypothetical protein
MRYTSIVVALMLLPSLVISQQDSLPKASLDGTVTAADTGAPIGGAEVLLVPSSIRPSGFLLPIRVSGAMLQGMVQGAVSSRSNTEGQFAVRDIKPGLYRVMVTADGYARYEFGQRVVGMQGTTISLAAGPVKTLDLRLTPTGSVTGQIFAPNGGAAVGVAVSLLQESYNEAGARIFHQEASSLTNERGEYRLYWVTPGRYYLVAQNPPLAGLFSGRSLNITKKNYAPTFYPGAADVADGSLIEVESGVELTGANITMLAERRYRVRGRVVDPLRGDRPITVSVESQTLAGGLQSGAGSRASAIDGSFVVEDVAPGAHLVTARIQGGTDRWVSDFVPITVVNSDLDGVIVRLNSPTPIEGRVRVEGRELPTVQGIQNMRISLVLADPNLPSNFHPVQFQSIRKDGTFEASSPLVGRYALRVSSVPAGFYVKEARSNLGDLLDSPIEFSGVSQVSLDILLSDKVGSVEGTLLNDKREPTTGAMIVLIPDQRLGRPDLHKVTQTDQTGRFRFVGIAPNTFRLFAFEALEQHRYFDAKLLKRFETHGRPVRVGPSENLVIPEAKLISFQEVLASGY